MSAFPPHTLARRQHGSILVNAAAGLGLMVVLLGAVDLGLLFHYKREYQKAADLAALAGSRQLATGCAQAVTAGTDSAATNLSQYTGDSSTIQPGIWIASGTPRFTAGCTDANAVRALIFGGVPTIFRGTINISAEGVALALEPIAQLTIRSSLAEFDTEKSTLLNGVVGGMLGGSINLSAVSYNGLAKTDINLLSFLDALAVNAGITAGDYDQVLNSDIALGELLEVAADVLEQGGGSSDPAGALGNAVGALGTINGTSLPALDTPIQLGELLSIASGVRASALDTNLNVFQLVQGAIQLANGSSVVNATLPIDVPGIATASVKLKVIEPAQLSAIGNPATDDISVRTAQVRALVTINLSGVTDLLNQLTSAVSPFLSPIVNFLNTAGSGFSALNLLGAVTNLLDDVFEALLQICTNNCAVRNAVYAEGLAQPLQISLDAATAQASVTDHECSAEKTLTVDAGTSVARLRVGSMSEANVFGSANPVVSPVSLVEIGYRRVRARTCFVLLGLGNCQDEQWEQNNGSFLTNGKATAKRYVISGLGLKVDTAVGSSPNPPDLIYESPDLPDVGEQPAYQDISATSVAGSLSGTLAGIEVMPYSSAAGGVLGSALTGTLSLLNATSDAVQGVIDNVLAGVLDPLIDSLMNAVGLELAAADVGANLSCEGGGGTLVE